MAVTRFDIQSGVDRLMFVAGQGHLIGLPTLPGISSLTNGAPVDNIVGWAAGAIWMNFKGTNTNDFFWINRGNESSSNWYLIA
jgi:hypothetical protein